MVNNWGDNPNLREYYFQKYLNHNKINTYMIGRRNSTIPKNSNTLFLDIPFNKNCTFHKSFFAGNLARFIIILYSTLFLLKFKPKFIYVRDIYFTTYFIILAKILRFKVISESHGMAFKELSYKKKFFKSKWLKPLEIFNYKNINYSVCITNTLKKNISSYTSDNKIFTIPNGIDIKEINEVRSNSGFQKSISNKNQTKLIGFIGHWERWIEIEDLLESSNFLGSNMKIVVVGKGYNYLKYKNKYKKVIFKGWLTRPRAWNLLSLFDVCVSPWSDDILFTEKSPRKTLEYLAFGKPIIVSDVPGRENFLKPNENCILYEYQNPKDLAIKTRKVLEDSLISQKLSKNNINLAKEFDWDQIFKRSKILEIFI